MCCPDAGADRRCTRYTVCTYLLLVARATTNGRDGATRITLNWVTDKRRRVGPAGIQGVPSPRGKRLHRVRHHNEIRARVSFRFTPPSIRSFVHPAPAPGPRVPAQFHPDGHCILGQSPTSS